MKWPQYIHGHRGGMDHIHDEVFSGMYELRYKPKLGDVVVDAGAHVGFYTCRASEWVGPEGQVFAFEPETANYKVLAGQHKAECGLANVALFQLGLWHEMGELVLNHSNSSAEHSLVHRQKNGDETDEKVMCVRLDDILPKKLARLDFIKIDVEGAEASLLLGARGVILEFRPHMVIEVDASTVDWVKQIVRNDYGYKIYQETPTVWSAVP